MVASTTVDLQIFKRPQLPHFPTDLDETGIKIHGLLRSFIKNIVIIRVAVRVYMMCMALIVCALKLLPQGAKGLSVSDSILRSDIIKFYHFKGIQPHTNNKL